MALMASTLHTYLFIVFLYDRIFPDTASSTSTMQSSSLNYINHVTILELLISVVIEENVMSVEVLLIQEQQLSSILLVLGREPVIEVILDAHH
jgi:hypothetical protein